MLSPKTALFSSVWPSGSKFTNRQQMNNLCSPLISKIHIFSVEYQILMCRLCISWWKTFEKIEKYTEKYEKNSEKHEILPIFWSFFEIFHTFLEKTLIFFHQISYATMRAYV